MRYNKYKFKWSVEGHITATLSFDEKVLTEFTIDDVDCDAFIKTLMDSRREAKKAKKRGKI